MDYIKEILSEKNKFKSEKWIKETFPIFHFFIDQKSIGSSWKEKLYLHINNLNPPDCYCGKKVEFISIYKGYRKYCSKKCLSSDMSVIEKRKNTSIIKYGFNNPMKSESVKIKLSNSILDKYGVDNISKLDSIKEKKAETCLINYGVRYNSQRESSKHNLSNLMKKKSNELNSKKHEKLISYLISKSIENELQFIEIIDTSIYKLKCELLHEFEIHKNTLNDRIINKNKICTICNPINNESDSQNQLFDFIKSIYDGEIVKNNRDIIGQELDILLPEKKLAFEFNGIFWHSDKFKDKNYHLNKTNLCESKDIHLIHIWEDDWRYKREIIKSRINNLLGKSDKIWGRLCKIKIIDTKSCREFLNKNHIQGYCPSKYNIGLLYKNELVSIMTFGNLRISLGQRSKDGSYELLRFCNKLGMSIVGGASKMFNFFIKQYNPASIISYADRCWSNGNLYRRLGFKIESITKPNYYYVINGIRKNRFNYRKDRLIKEGFDSNKTEFEIMKERGYNKIYDVGNYRFIYQV